LGEGKGANHHAIFISNNLKCLPFGLSMYCILFYFKFQRPFSACISWLLTSIDFQRFQLLASINLIQLTNNTRMTISQTKFQVMIVMNVLSMMHWIVDDIEVEM
jgi:hypothetical protein